MLIIGVLFLVIGGGLGIAFIFLVNAILGVSVAVPSVLFGIVFVWMGQTTDRLKEVLKMLKSEE
ncbi:unnamed protein product [marine sediment metagenome]|uniref:Uncharacterized protein n=1 Tax=marine sediment metagenome TaxID=412755 RepID=X1L0Q4_9ZZZZ